MGTANALVHICDKSRDHTEAIQDACQRVKSSLKGTIKNAASSAYRDVRTV
jgi:hypothetical protein